MIKRTRKSGRTRVGLRAKNHLRFRTGLTEELEPRCYLSGSTYTIPIPDLIGSGDGADFSRTHFGPSTLMLESGVLLVVTDVRKNSDLSANGISVRRSLDHGQTWLPATTVFYDPARRLNPGGTVQDKTTGEIFCFFQENVDRVLVISSVDDGLTWSEARDVTDSVKKPGWGWVATGPSHGIQLENGPHAGRLIIAGDHRYTADNSGPSWSQVFYSDDHGQTWHLGGDLESNSDANKFSNEATVVELNNGDLYMSMRLVNDELAVYRASSRSTDGGLTWSSMSITGDLTTPSVLGTLLRVNPNLILFSAPSTRNDRSQMAIWASTDEAQTWQLLKVIDYHIGSYSDMAMIDSDTLLFTYNVTMTAGLMDPLQRLTARTIELPWLMDGAPAEFNWYFNEQAPGTPANTGSISLYDYSFWQNHAQPITSDTPPMYIAGRNGGSALALGSGSDRVQLVPGALIGQSAGDAALSLGSNDSITIQMAIRTTGTDGVILGSMPNTRGWWLKLVGGKVQFALKGDQTNQLLSVQHDQAINDGQWHRLVVIRNAVTKNLVIYVDGVASIPIFDSSNFNTISSLAVTLGSNLDGSSQLALDVDYIRVTRGAVAPADFVAANFVKPVLPGPTAPPANSPLAIPGLQFWLAAYNANQFWADKFRTVPLETVPRFYDAVGSGWDSSTQKWEVISDNLTHYAYDSVMGAYWLTDPDLTGNSHGWRVANSNGTKATNFDFLQNTATFTISTAVRFDSLNGLQTIVDTANGTTINPGINLTLNGSGSLQLSISNFDGQPRYVSTTAVGPLTAETWYHLVVVASGIGSPVQYYLTPLSSSSVRSYSNPAAVAGANGNFPTAANQDLTWGSTVGGASRLIGGIVDSTIFNRALTASEVQQLFNFEKRTVAPLPHAPVVLPVTMQEDRRSSAIVIQPDPLDGTIVQSYQISGITNGTLYRHDTVTPIHNGDFVPASDAAQGLYFVPAQNYSGKARFSILASASASQTNIGFDPAVCMIDVLGINDPPTANVPASLAVIQNTGSQVFSQFVTQIAPGPANEVGQEIFFEVTNDNPGLFTVGPSIDSAGNLVFTPTREATGTAVVTIRLRDNGGTENGGIDLSVPHVLILYVQPYNVHPAFTMDPIEWVATSSGQRTVPNWAHDITLGFPTPTSPISTFVLTNDQPGLFSVQPSISSSGTLTYQPAPGASGVAHLVARLDVTDGSTTNQSLPIAFEIAIGNVLTLGTAQGLSDAADNVVIRRNGNNVSIVINGGTPITQSLASLVGIQLNTAGGDDRVTIDYTQGVSLPSGGLILAAGSENDTLMFLGSGSETVTQPEGISSALHGQIAVNGVPVMFDHLEVLAADQVQLYNVIAGRYQNDITLESSTVTTSRLSNFSLPVYLSRTQVLGIDTTNLLSLLGDDAIHVLSGGMNGVGQLDLKTGDGIDRLEIVGASVPVSWTALHASDLSVTSGNVNLLTGKDIGQLSLTNADLNMNQNVSSHTTQLVGTVKLNNGVGATLDLGNLNFATGLSLTKNGVGSFTLLNVASSFENLVLNLLQGTTTVQFDLGRTSQVSVEGNAVFGSSQHLASLSIRENGRVRLTAGRNKILVVDALNIGSSAALDIADNFARITATPQTADAVYDSIWGYARAGYNRGYWSGLGGINSSSVLGAGAFHNGGLAVFPNHTIAELTLLAEVPSEVWAPTDTVIYYGPTGDADLSGTIDYQDYPILDAGPQSGIISWLTGDLNYDGVVNGVDYAIVDNAINFPPSSGSPLSSGFAPQPLPSGETSVAALGGTSLASTSLAPLIVTPQASAPTITALPASAPLVPLSLALSSVPDLPAAVASPVTADMAYDAALAAWYSSQSLPWLDETSLDQLAKNQMRIVPRLR